MRSQRRLELRVGLFLTSGLVLTLLVIWVLGSAQNLFARHVRYFITVPDAAGISPGAKVTISGVDAGVVQSVSLNSTDQSVKVNLNISSQFEDSIRRDSFSEIVTVGVLGDKSIAIAAGTQNSPKLLPGIEIPARPAPSLETLLGKGDRLASEISFLTKDVDQLVAQFNRQLRGDHLGGSLAKLDSILGKIDQGNGTLGEFLNDPKLYDDVKALVGEANNNRIVRNLIRKTIEDAKEKKKDFGSN